MSRIEPAPANLQYRRVADDDGELVFEVTKGRSDLRLEVSPSPRMFPRDRDWRLRLLAGERRLMWAEVWTGLYGVTLVRSDDEASPEILPPFRAREARAQSDIGWWMRRIAQLLVDSPRSPLRTGTWRLSTLRPDGHVKSRYVSPLTTRIYEPAAVACGLPQAATSPVVRDDDFGAAGSYGVWPLRRPSAPDSPRVKAWRTHAREGTLPPVVLWWFSALTTSLILDGHDRLTAAVAEGVEIPTVVLMPVEERAPSPERMKLNSEAYARYFDDPVMNDTGRAALARSLVSAFTPTLHPGVATAVCHTALDDEWDAEVGALVGA